MKRKILFIVGILFFSIIIVGALRIPLEFLSSEPILTGISSKNFLSWLKWDIIESKKINESLLPVYQKLIHKPAPISLCEKISWVEDKYTCLALVKENEEICSKINNIEDRDQCHFLIDEAKGTNSPSVCERMESISQKEQCYEKLAIRLGDPSLCEKAKSIREEKTDIDYRNAMCYISVKDSIAKNKAKIEKDISFCKELKSFFREDCYYEVAVAKNDVSICKEITTNECKQAECIAVIKNPYACERCVNKGCCGILSFRQTCYNKGAISLEDPAFCGDAGDGDSKNDCYFKLALKLAGIKIEGQ